MTDTTGRLVRANISLDGRYHGRGGLDDLAAIAPS